MTQQQKRLSSELKEKGSMPAGVLATALSEAVCARLGALRQWHWMKFEHLWLLKLGNMMFFSVLLGMGMLLGVVTISLHSLGYIGSAGPLLSALSSSPPLVPASNLNMTIRPGGPLHANNLTDSISAQSPHDVNNTSLDPSTLHPLHSNNVTDTSLAQSPIQMYNTSSDQNSLNLKNFEDDSRAPNVSSPVPDLGLTGPSFHVNSSVNSDPGLQPQPDVSTSTNSSSTGQTAASSREEVLQAKPGDESSSRQLPSPSTLQRSETPDGILDPQPDSSTLTNSSPSPGQRSGSPPEVFLQPQPEVSTLSNSSPPTVIQPTGSSPAVVYQNTSSVYHEMTDEELLWKASTMAPPQIGAQSINTRAKIAFMFLTKGPMPFAPLWDRFFRGHEELFSIYIHAHPNFKPNISSSSAFYGRYIPSQVVRWGEISMYHAERRLLANALLDPSNARFILLSEACIPLSNFESTYKHITQSRYSFIQSYDDPGKSGQGRLARIHKHERENMAPEITLKNWRKGSQWFEITRELALLVVADKTYYNKFARYMCRPHPVCYIDEHYLPTVLTILRPSQLAYRTLTYYDFKHGGAHPHNWNEHQVTESLLRSLRDGHTCSYNDKPETRCFFFARKFDPDALEALLELAPKVMGII